MKTVRGKLEIEAWCRLHELAHAPRILAFGIFEEMSSLALDPLEWGALLLSVPELHGRVDAGQPWFEHFVSVIESKRPISSKLLIQGAKWLHSRPLPALPRPHSRTTNSPDPNSCDRLRDRGLSREHDGSETQHGQPEMWHDYLRSSSMVPYGSSLGMVMTLRSARDHSGGTTKGSSTPIWSTGPFSGQYAMDRVPILRAMSVGWPAVTVPTDRCFPGLST